MYKKTGKKEAHSSFISGFGWSEVSHLEKFLSSLKLRHHVIVLTLWSWTSRLSFFPLSPSPMTVTAPETPTTTTVDDNIASPAPPHHHCDMSACSNDNHTPLPHRRVNRLFFTFFLAIQNGNDDNTTTTTFIDVSTTPPMNNEQWWQHWLGMGGSRHIYASRGADLEWWGSRHVYALGTWYVFFF